jgi:hypothetical protein
MNPELFTGDIVSIEGKAGKIPHAEVADVRDTGEMPILSGLEDLSEQACQILAEEFARVAVIDYDYQTDVNQIPVRFVALQDFNGVWWDLKGHPLTIVKAQERAN